MPVAGLWPLDGEQQAGGRIDTDYAVSAVLLARCWRKSECPCTRDLAASSKARVQWTCHDRCTHHCSEAQHSGDATVPNGAQQPPKTWQRATTHTHTHTHWTLRLSLSLTITADRTASMLFHDSCLRRRGGAPRLHTEQRTSCIRWL